MKEYFKYANGYVNIKGDDLFLTNSGNWSEIQDLKEKSPKTASQNRLKRFRFDFFFFIVLLLIGFAVMRFFKNGSITFPIVMVALGFGVYRYFKNETGNSYKIPRQKIIRIDLSGQQATIVFYNEQEQQDLETLSGIEPKGVDLLQQLYPPTNP
ncbi:hypothetical protein [Flavobacterium sp.]|uniref:hypothetical protein n=1 Tax=Flavobacterium sp. TaxID=239 RepID=UPI0039E6E881